jgi:hypothetical protein
MFFAGGDAKIFRITTSKKHVVRILLLAFANDHCANTLIGEELAQ